MSVRAGRFAAILIALLSAASIAACGNDVDNGVKGDQPAESDSLTIYVSMPAKGSDKAQADQLARGMKLRLAEEKGKIGDKTLKWQRLDDTGADGEWDDGQVTDNARIAVRDRTTVAFIGEMDSGASALSIPILNEAGVLQVSPTSGYSGLTRKDGVVQGEPDKYYPSGKRTFGRVTPGDHVQAAAQVDVQRSAGCRSIYLLRDDELYGTGLAKAIQNASEKADLRVAGEDSFDPESEDFTSIAAKVADSAADCVFVGTSDPVGAARLFRALHRADSSLTLFGPDRLVTAAFTGRLGAAAADTRLTSPHLRLSDYPESARQVLREYRKQYGSAPTLDALYGYATMDAVIEAIREGRGSGSTQRRTIAGFFDLDRDSVLGEYTINDDGDSSLSQYGSYTVVDGRPRFDAVIDTD